ncbi:MAG: hypothetical protein DCC58_15800, partial [Chloroflexi bacterium]
MTGPKKRRLTADDLLRLEQVSDARMHPSDARIVYCVSASVSAPKQQQFPSRLWCVDSASGSDPQALTAEGTCAHKPRWSPDGSSLAFLGSRDIAGKDQLFLLPDGPGEARCLTDCAGGVVDYAWGPATGELTLLVSDPPPADAAERERSGADQVVYEEDARFNRLYRLSLDGTLAALSKPATQVYEFAWSTDGTELVGLVADAPHNWCWYQAYLATLDVETGEWTPLFRSHKQFTAPAWSPDGAAVTAWRGHPDRINSLTFDRQGLLLASAGNDCAIHLWDASALAEERVHSRRPLLALRGHQYRVRSIAFSPDGRLLASGSNDQTVRLWDVHNGRCLRVLDEHDSDVLAVAFHPAGRYVASGSYDRSVRLWDTAGQEAPLVLRGHTDWVRALAFHPGGRLLASGGDDLAIRVWDPDSGRCVEMLCGHTRPIRGLLFTPDG